MCEGAESRAWREDDRQGMKEGLQAGHEGRMTGRAWIGGRRTEHGGEGRDNE